MKKELEKILRTFEGSFVKEDGKLEFELYQCDCCGDWTGRIINNQSEKDWSITIEDPYDMMEFDDMVQLVIGAPFFGLVGILKDIKDKKFEKKLDKFYDLADNWE